MAATLSDQEDQSSLDLSLCLRRGSNDSRDSFYMDFDRGIDSDIDAGPDHHHHHHHHHGAPGEDSYSGGEASDDDCTLSGRTPQHHRHSRHCHTSEWTGLRSHHCQTDEETALPPSPVCPARILASPELGSIMSSQGTSSGGGGSKLPNGKTSSTEHGSDVPFIRQQSECPGYEEAVKGIPGVEKERGRLLLPSASRRTTIADGDLDDDVFTKAKEIRPLQKRTNIDSVVSVLSAMYAKLLVVMGIGFPLAEVISPYIPPSFFVGFYLYLYSSSILFLVYAYSFLLKSDEGPGFRVLLLRKMSLMTGLGGKTPTSDGVLEVPREVLNRKRQLQDTGVSCGSFYLRMGAVAFGIGSMIYSGLEFGQFFEVNPNSECYSILTAITPCTQMIFIFVQLYFIFMNSKMRIYRYKNIARFGLMHMVATNLCAWLYVLVQESKHEILKFTDPSHGGGSHTGTGAVVPHTANVVTTTGHPSVLLPNNATMEVHHRVERGLRHAGASFQCRRVNIMGQLVQDVSPFLFPCTIEYSLICAAILYMMWRNIGKMGRVSHRGGSISSEAGLTALSSRRHHYSVDCAHANKGLFTGILVLVLAIISLILFFVLINKPEYKELAVLEAHISELVLYCLNTIAAVIALMQVRELRYSSQHYVELDNILLIVAQTGVYLFAIFCVIGGHFTISRNTVLVLLTALANLAQATVQTIFILDASRRFATTPEQVRRKPGREMITFLLVCNFAMWAINSLETRRADSNPVQLNFYGFWAWTIIAHISTPLAIFFRFHSTVCLCEIWKKLYKLKGEHV